MDTRTGDIFDYEAMDKLSDTELMKQLGDRADDLKPMKLAPTAEQLGRTPDHPKAIGKVNPEDACPCGSGKTFENCCKTLDDLYVSAWKAIGLEFWIVGQWKPVWEFFGAFTSKELAVEACTTETHFVAGPFKIDERLPDDVVTPEVSFYPLREKAPE